MHFPNIVIAKFNQHRKPVTWTQLYNPFWNRDILLTHSPLRQVSLLASFSPLTYMLKLSGSKHETSDKYWRFAAAWAQATYSGLSLTIFHLAPTNCHMYAAYTRQSTINDSMYAAHTNGKLHLVATRKGSHFTQCALPSSHTWQQTESHVLRWHTNESCSRLNHLLVHWILQFTVHITTSYILHQIPGWCIHHWLIYGTEQTQVQGTLRSQLPDCNFIR